MPALRGDVEHLTRVQNPASLNRGNLIRSGDSTSTWSCASCDCHVTITIIMSAQEYYFSLANEWSEQKNGQLGIIMGHLHFLG